MNPEQRLEALRTLVGQIRDEEYPYEERPTPTTEWASYDEAQIHETNDVLDLIPELVELAQGRVDARTIALPRRGQPATPAADITKILLAQSFLQRANRPAEGLGLLFREKLRIASRVSYKTIERAFDRVGVARLLDEVFLLTNEPVRGLERVFSGDGSGSPKRVGVHYPKDRERERDKGETSDALSGHPGDYAYHFAIVGVKYKVLAGWRGVAQVRKGSGEHSLFPKAMAVLAQTGHTVEAVLGDGLMATRPCCRIVAELGAKPYFLPKRNTTFKSHGVHAWVRMVADLLDHPQEWLEQFHMRSISEATFSVFNRANPRPLRKKLERRVETEDYLRGIVYNIKRLAYLRYMADIHPLPDA